MLAGCGAFVTPLSGCLGGDDEDPDEGDEEENGEEGEADDPDAGDGGGPADDGGRTDPATRVGDGDPDSIEGDPEALVDSFYEAFFAADVETLRSLTHPDARDDVLGDAETQIETQVERVDDYELAADLRAADDEIAVVRYDGVVEFEDGEEWTYTADVTLRPHEGEWRFYEETSVR